MMKQLLLSIFLAVLVTQTFAAEKPNIVIILADDLGWRDVGCFGSPYYQTPHLDALAARGVRFTSGYASAPLCSATRASLLTGRSPARVNITSTCTYQHQEIEPSTTGPAFSRVVHVPQYSELRHEEVTMAEVLKANGYATAHVGKWHLGTESWYPQTNGFDVNKGGRERGSSPYFRFRNGEVVAKDPQEYLTDRLTDEAVSFIQESKKGPFFLYLAHHAVHGPMQAKPEKIAAYEKSIPADSPQRNATYAAMVESLDESVGRIVKTLNDTGLAENTLLVFTSDNGGVAEHAPGEFWTSNLPLRGQKADLLEGGIRVPWIIAGAGVTKPGSVCAEPVISYDIFPSVLECSGIQKPADLVLDGTSFMPLLRGEQVVGRPLLFWYYPHQSPKGVKEWGEPRAALREGPWKLIQILEGSSELYNLDADIGESKNLASEQPELVLNMRAKLEARLHETIPPQWFPHPNPKYDPQAKPPIEEFNKRHGRGEE